MPTRSTNLSIQEVSRKLQLPKSTIRFWEQEFKGLIMPHRTSGGHRRYSDKDVVVLEFINSQKKKGMALPEIKEELAKNWELQSQLDGNAVDQLAERITRAVYREILQFLSDGHNPGQLTNNVNTSPEGSIL